MTSFRTRSVTVGAVLLALAVPLAGQQKSAIPSKKSKSASADSTPAPSPQMERLSKMLLGSWNTSEKFEPSSFMPKGGSGKGTETFHSGPGGLSVIADYQSQSKDLGSNFRGHAILNWNEAQKSYQAYWIDSMSPAPTLLSGNWQGDDLIFSGTADMEQKMDIKWIYKDIAANGFTFVEESAESGKPTKETMSIKYSRATSTKPSPAKTSKSQ